MGKLSGKGPYRKMNTLALVVSRKTAEENRIGANENRSGRVIVSIESIDLEIDRLLRVGTG